MDQPRVNEFGGSRTIARARSRTSFGNQYGGLGDTAAVIDARIDTVRSHGLCGENLVWDEHGYYEVALDAGELTLAP